MRQSLQGATGHDRCHEGDEEREVERHPVGHAGATVALGDEGEVVGGRGLPVASAEDDVVRTVVRDGLVGELDLPAEEERPVGVGGADPAVTAGASRLDRAGVPLVRVLEVRDVVEDRLHRGVEHEGAFQLHGPTLGSA